MHIAENYTIHRKGRFCHYDPTVGRWTTKDPIGFAGGDTNLYAYVGGDPMSNVDPTGLKITFGDLTSERIFNTLRNSSALSDANRKMIDALERSSAIINITHGTAANRPDPFVYGRTTGYKNSRDSEIELWRGGTDNYSLMVLLHELVHSNQIMNGIRAGTDSSENEAYSIGDSFYDRCKKPAK